MTISTSSPCRALRGAGAVRDDRLHLGLRDGGLVAEEVDLAELGRDLLVEIADRLVAGALPLGAGALLGHVAVEAPLVHREAALARDDPGEVHREAEGVVELEGDLARDDLLLRPVEAGHLLLEDLEAAVERPAEGLLLLRRHLGDEGAALAGLGVGGAHLLDDGRADVGEEELLEPEPLPVPDRAPHDAPEDVAAPLVRGQHAVADEEGRRPRVVRDDAHRDRVVLVRAVLLAGDLLDGADDVLEQVGVVVRALPLRDRRHALEPRARVDRGLRQRREVSAGAPLELHEDEVPDLEPAIAVARDALALPPGLLLGARDVVSLEVVELRARPARTGVPHRPEVVLRAELVDPVGRDALRLPELVRLLVPGQSALAVEHGGGEPLLREAEPARAGHELPAPGDGVLLEVVAEGEVPEHLEERVVTRGEAHVLEVVVLAPGAHALLGRRRARVVPLLAAGEDVLELDHPGVREEERGIVVRDERGALHAAVGPLLEEAEEGLADLGGGRGLHGRATSYQRGARRATRRPRARATPPARRSAPPPPRRPPPRRGTRGAP